MLRIQLTIDGIDNSDPSPCILAEKPYAVLGVSHHSGYVVKLTMYLEPGPQSAVTSIQVVN